MQKAGFGPLFSVGLTQVSGVASEGIALVCGAVACAISSGADHGEHDRTAAAAYGPAGRDHSRLSHALPHLEGAAQTLTTQRELARESPCRRGRSAAPCASTASRSRSHRSTVRLEPLWVDGRAAREALSTPATAPPSHRAGSLGGGRLAVSAQGITPYVGFDMRQDVEAPFPYTDASDHRLPVRPDSLGS